MIEHMFAEGGLLVLTPRQQQIWDFVVEYVDTHGYPPTVREIGDAVGLASPSTVHAHLANLERAGLLRRDPTKPRALELVGRERPASARPSREEDMLPLVDRPLLSYTLEHLARYGVGRAIISCGYLPDQIEAVFGTRYGGVALEYAVEEEPLEWFSSREGPDARVQRFEYPKGGRGFNSFIRACVRASAGLEEPPITTEETLQIIRTVYGFYQAARTGQTQTI